MISEEHNKYFETIAEKLGIDNENRTYGNEKCYNRKK